MKKVEEFFNQEEGSNGTIVLVVAVALFIVFAAFQGGMISTVQTVAGDFVNKLDALSIADSSHTM